MISKLKVIFEDRLPVASGNKNAYDELSEKIYNQIHSHIIETTDQNKFSAAVTVESKLKGEVLALKECLDGFLEKQGLSNENLSDVSRANERIAELEQEIRIGDSKLAVISGKMEAFAFNAQLKLDYEKAIVAKLEPINKRLKSLSGEVKPIDLSYVFNFEKA